MSKIPNETTMNGGFHVADAPRPLVMGETRTWAELDRLLREKCGTTLAERVAALRGAK